jgi:hypothetical protein
MLNRTERFEELLSYENDEGQTVCVAANADALRANTNAATVNPAHNVRIEAPPERNESKKSSPYSLYVVPPSRWLRREEARSRNVTVAESPISVILAENHSRVRRHRR